MDGSTRAAAERLTVAFASSLRSDANGPELRGALCAFVDAARSAGESIERVIVEVKRIARESELRPSPYFRRTGAPWTSRDDLISQTVTACIKRYFDPELQQPSSAAVTPTAADDRIALRPLKYSMDDPRWVEIALASRAGRLNRSVEMLVAYHRLLVQHTSARAKFNDAMEQSKTLRAERTFTAAIRASDKMEREELRMVIHARVRELRTTSFSRADVVTAIRNIVTDAVQQAGFPASSDFLQQEAVEWALEALNVASLEA